jgi:hypothetical protein
MYQHEDQLVKNSLMDGLINYNWIIDSKRLTKNEARKIISGKGIDENLLNQRPVGSEIYELVEEKFN